MPRGCSSRVYQGLLPTAIAHGITTRGARRRVAVETRATTSSAFPDRTALWPLLIGAWKRKPAAEPPSA